MASTSGRRRSIRSAGIALAVWLAAIAALTLWRYPSFWVEPGERFRRAEALARERRPAEALNEIRAALARHPRDADYLTFKAYRHLDLGDLESAERAFRDALAAVPRHAEATLGLAATLGKRQRRDDALRTLDALPSEASAVHVRRRSQLYGEMSAPAPAIEDLSHLLHADPANPALLREAATHALTLRDWPRARAFADRLSAAARTAADREFAERVARDAQHGEAAAAAAATEARRAEIARQIDRRKAAAFDLARAGRRAEAEAGFRALVADGAADAQVRQAYAWLLNVERRYAEAWLAIEPLPMPARDPAILELQARTAFWAGRYRDAVQLFAALLAHRPADPELWKRLAEAWSALGDRGQAATAWRAYLRLESQDAAARQQLADMLAAEGSLEAAIAEYELLAAQKPDDPSVLRRAGLLHETAGRLERAREYYERALERDASPDVVLRVARLHRWSNRPRAALDWFRRYVSDAGTDAAPVQAEIALTLLDAGQPGESLAQLQALSKQAPLADEDLVTAARAATAVGQPAEAARLLELLSARRALTEPEERWLAGQYRAAGARDAALRAYDRVSARSARVARDVAEAIGDLRFDAGDYRGALRAFTSAPDDPVLLLKTARAAAASGDLAVADRAFTTYLAEVPGDAAARLEAARYFAAAGRPSRAIDTYRTVVAARGADGLRVELARVQMADERFADAESWARQAVAAGEGVEAARLVLAQALHVQGKNREASAVLREVLAAAPQHAEALAWRGQVDVALDRHADAYRSFERALAAGADRTEQILLWMGTAARKRGDYGRASITYARAADKGAAAPQVDAARRELRAAVLPRVQLPLWTHGDSNGLRLGQAGGGVSVFLPRLTGAVALNVSSGVLSQGTFSTELTRATVTLSQLFPTPRVQLGLGVGLNRFSRGDDLITWRGEATYHAGDAAAFGLSAARQALLPLEGPLPLRQFNRVLDAKAIGPAFYADGIGVFAEWLTRPTQRAHVEGGVERFQDGNRQTYAYAHYQVPLATGVRRWTVMRPNVFFETFRRDNPAYFSPGHHLTVGTMLHTIRQYPHWDLEFEVNPQWLRTDGRHGVAAHGLVNVGVRVGRVTVSAGTFLFYDGLEDYLQWRAGGRVTVPLRR